MRARVFLFICIFLPLTFFSQTTDTIGIVQADTTFYTIASIEEMPEFPGGEAELMKFIHKNLTYPQLCMEMGIQGRVYMSFIVETDGSVRYFQVKKAVPECPDMTKEVIRVLSLMPKWKPGKQNGKAVRTQFIIPIRFKLENPAPTPLPADSGK